MRQSAVLERAVQERARAGRTSRGLPVGAMAWQRPSSSPSAPATFCADPAQIVLGRALEARAMEATKMIAEAAVAAGMRELASGRLAKQMHDLHKLATRAIARFLVTGQGTTETERNFTGKVGVMAAVFGLSASTLNQSYSLWRECNLRVLNEEVRRLGTPLTIYDEARRLIRSSAETGIKRMVQAYEDQLALRDVIAVPRHRAQLRARAL